MYFSFDHSYSQLPDIFYEKILPTPVSHPQLVIFNEALASELGIKRDKNDTDAELAAYFSGNKIFPGTIPIAQVYAGHQFGHFVPQLGDGRAILLGEIITPEGLRFDMQLKGSGKTRYSRGGDGRAQLGPMLREYIMSEAMHALGIKTTRSLAVVKTGEFVLRDHPLPGAILTRIASSHIRIGTFEYFAARQDIDSLKILLDYTIKRHYPNLLSLQEKYLFFLKEVFERQAALVVDWMAVGFIHGVMNTDNMSINGETIDYGPCAFLDEYVPNKTFSSIDHAGRYAFNNQGDIVLWNLMQLYEAVKGVLVKDVEFFYQLQTELVQNFIDSFNKKYREKLQKKIGIFEAIAPKDEELIENLFEIMAADQLDYTLTFRYLSHLVDSDVTGLENIFQPSPALVQWVQIWLPRVKKQKLGTHELSQRMKALNPALIPRNHRIEEALHAATFADDLLPLKQLVLALSSPYQEDPKFKHFMQAPQPSEKIHQTFCGT